jgi:hypothetical protein
MCSTPDFYRSPFDLASYPLNPNANLWPAHMSNRFIVQGDPVSQLDLLSDRNFSPDACAFIPDLLPPFPEPYADRALSVKFELSSKCFA